MFWLSTMRTAYFRFTQIFLMLCTILIILL
jgi:hypothetical protein